MLMISVVVVTTAATEVPLRRVTLLGGCTTVVRGFFFGIVLFLRAARFPSYSSLELTEEFSCSSSHSHRWNMVVVSTGIFSGKGRA